MPEARSMMIKNLLTECQDAAETCMTTSRMLTQCEASMLEPMDDKALMAMAADLTQIRACCMNVQAAMTGA